MNFVALLAMLMLVGGSATAWAQNYPTLSELTGRYRLTGDCMVEGDGFPVTTDYNMVILPGAEEGTVQLNGFFGYGGGLTGTYDEQTGTLHFSAGGAYLCATMDSYWSSGEFIVADPGVGGTIELGFTITRSEEGGIVLTTDSSFIAMDQFRSAAAGYMNGFTLTKESVSKPLSDLAGTYHFTSRTGMIANMLESASDEFTMTVTPSGDNKVTISGLFGLPECVVEATYYEDGGIVVLPRDVAFTDELYMGNNEEMGVMAYEAAPYFYVNDTEWTTSSSFILNGSIDWDMEMFLSASFVGGKAVKTTEDAVQHVASASNAQIVVEGGVITVTSPVAENVRVYDVQGRMVASAAGTKVTIASLPTGVYLVKVGKDTCKIAL